jgi:hypothetical protein
MLNRFLLNHFNRSMLKSAHCTARVGKIVFRRPEKKSQNRPNHLSSIPNFIAAALNSALIASPFESGNVDRKVRV